MIITADWEDPVGWGEVKGRVDQDMLEISHWISFIYTTY